MGKPKIFINQDELDRLEALREAKRKTGRLTYDCYNLKTRIGGRVYCSKGRMLGRARDGSLGELSVLRGMTSGTCKGCPDYND